jgi:hypothetical protein
MSVVGSRPNSHPFELSEESLFLSIELHENRARWQRGAIAIAMAILMKWAAAKISLSGMPARVIILAAIALWLYGFFLFDLG